jgi:Zn-dependent alcohol dehydrogenase
MPTEARVVVAPESGDMYVADIALPDPGPRQVVVRQYASGICHSQLHQLHGVRRRPMLLGHESTGTVVAAGDEVSHVAVGDTVLVTWVPRSRDEAREWNGGIRLDVGNGVQAGTADVFTWADHTLVDQSLVVKAPDTIAKDVTAIIGCAVMTGAGAVLNTAGVRAGESVAVFGVGGVGLSAVVAAASVGANPIIAVDLDPTKLEFARHFGATNGVDASAGDAVEQIRALTADKSRLAFRGTPMVGVDYAFDCIGVKVTMEQIVAAIRPGVLGGERGGTAVLVGVPQTTVELPAVEMLTGEKRFVASLGGSCSPDEDFPTFLQWHADGRLDLDALVTERFAIDDINEACAALAAGKISGRAILEFPT